MNYLLYYVLKIDVSASNFQMYQRYKSSGTFFLMYVSCVQPIESGKGGIKTYYKLLIVLALS